nr:immunoglobulin light chain junction region [Macaca mulatta]MOV68602.1 immunoglobulin light chain junction region [Macaca mulatta]MOV69313.1 immunoglobulin light chain junction region [Macaca mulatta]MOV69498.1 immunoglobulin light chain junction region [Macaca mulatta]MOV69976.1 immunoglobulin light chain junction region [Macaca mulatta]
DYYCSSWESSLNWIF